MRAIMSPSGSFIGIVCSSPARLHEAGDQSPGAKLAQRNARQLELAIETARPAGHLASIAHACLRGIARQFGKLERCREALLHRPGLIARDRSEASTPGTIFFAQLSPPAVL